LPVASTDLDPFGLGERSEGRPALPAAVAFVEIGDRPTALDWERCGRARSILPGSVTNERS
jgi:hypothetical protein